MDPHEATAVPGAAQGPASTLALPLVYINLDEDTSRRSAMEAALSGASVYAERLPATRWTRLHVDQQTQLYSTELNVRTYFRPLADGEKGCYASHIDAWHQLVRSSAPALVVLEDDVTLMPEFTSVIHAITALPQDWDVFKLIGRRNEQFVDPRSLVGRFKWGRYARVPSSTEGYVVSRRGAEKLLASRVPFGRPVDVDLRLWWENGLRVRGVHPSPLGRAPYGHVSSIASRRRGVGMRQNWARFVFKARYTLLNAAHRWFGRP